MQEKEGNVLKSIYLSVYLFMYLFLQQITCPTDHKFCSLNLCL